MSEGLLTPELQRFIARYIESVEKLEILLLLKKTPGKVWASQEVYQQIQSSLGSVDKKLKELAADGLLKRDSEGRFQFEPKSPDLQDQVAALDSTYQQRRIKVVEAIYSESTDNLRKFADAFRLRKDAE